MTPISLYAILTDGARQPVGAGFSVTADLQAPSALGDQLVLVSQVNASSDDDGRVTLGLAPGTWIVRAPGLLIGKRSEVTISVPATLDADGGPYALNDYITRVAGAPVVVPTGNGGPGSAGPAGPTGDVGPVGPAGADGAPGDQGPAGSDGTPGADGAQGPAGPQGLPGADGAQGVAGTPGAAGAQGPQGIAGPQGPAGPQGVAGAVGAQGPAGAQGPQGVAGAQGAAGPAGAQGPAGAAAPAIYGLTYDAADAATVTLPAALALGAEVGIFLWAIHREYGADRYYVRMATNNLALSISDSGRYYILRTSATYPGATGYTPAFGTAEKHFNRGVSGAFQLYRSGREIGNGLAGPTAAALGTVVTLGGAYSAVFAWAIYLVAPSTENSRLATLGPNALGDALALPDAANIVAGYDYRSGVPVRLGSTPAGSVHSALGGAGQPKMTRLT